MKRGLVRGATCAIIVAAGLQTRGYVQEPVFRAGVNLVPVDIAVLDKNKKPVTDLKQSDFTVFENGKQQDIKTFFAQAIEPDESAAAATPVLVRSATPSQEALGPKRRRTFLIVLGSASSGAAPAIFSPMFAGRSIAPPSVGPSPRLDGPGNAIDATLSFLRERLLPQDLVGVLAFNRVSDLTTHHQQVAQVIERFREQEGAVLASIDPFPWEDLSAAAQARIDAVFQPAGAPPRDRLNMRSAMRLLLDSPELKGDYRFSVPGMSYGGPRDMPWNKRVVAGDVEKLYAGIEYLRAVEGDKQLIWVTGSGLANPRWSVQDDKRLAMTAATARVTLNIYYTNPSGWAISAAQRASEISGGQYTGVKQAAELFERIDQATRFGYLIGYATPNPVMDNKVRNITVKVNRPGLTVLFRHGYVATPPLTPAQQKLQVINARLKVGAAFGVEAHDIEIKARAQFAPGPNKRVFVETTIDASQITFASLDTERTAQIEIQVFCGDVKENVLGQIKQTMNLKVSEDVYQRMLTNGIPYSARVPISGDPTYVKVLVYDFGADRLGAAVVKLR